MTTFKKYLMKIIFFCVCVLSPLHANENEDSWKVFKSIELTLEICPSSLSPLEIEIRDEIVPATVSLYALKTGDEIKINPKKFASALSEANHLRQDPNQNNGPFVGHTNDFILIKKHTNTYYLLSREIRLKRVIIVPLLRLGDVYIKSGPGRIFIGDSPLMTLTNEWINAIIP